MNKSESIANLAKALSIAQSSITGAIKDSTNPHFRNDYASLEACWDAIREPLSKNGLSIVQVNKPHVDGVLIETVLMHASGEWISGELYMPSVKKDPQGFGSATTYARRYSLSAMVGLVQVDDDGSAASGLKPAAMEAPKVRDEERPQGFGVNTHIKPAPKKVTF